MIKLENIKSKELVAQNMEFCVKEAEPKSFLSLNYLAVI